MTRNDIVEAYLDYRNNYLSVERYAEHKGLHEHEARRFIELALDVFNANHPEA